MVLQYLERGALPSLPVFAQGAGCRGAPRSCPKAKAVTVEAVSRSWVSSLSRLLIRARPLQRQGTPTLPGPAEQGDAGILT